MPRADFRSVTRVVKPSGITAEGAPRKSNVSIGIQEGNVTRQYSNQHNEFRRWSLLLPDLRPRRRWRMALILVVDDDEDIRDVTALLLQQHGYEVATASNGREALE